MIHCYENGLYKRDYNVKKNIAKDNNNNIKLPWQHERCLLLSDAIYRFYGFLFCCCLLAYFLCFSTVERLYLILNALIFFRLAKFLYPLHHIPENVL